MISDKKISTIYTITYFKLLFTLSIACINFSTLCFNNSLSLLNSFSVQEPTQEFYSYILRLQFPHAISKSLILCGYYKGEELEFDTDFCTLIQTQEAPQFALFIAKPEHAPRPKSDGKNIYYLERRAHAPCRLFYFTRRTSSTNAQALEGKPLWLIEEEQESNIPTRIPDDAIILLINPNYIQEVKEKTADKYTEKIGATTLINLPTIILKPTLTQEQLQQASDTSLLASLDLKAIHRRMPKTIKQECKKDCSIRICMRTP